MSNDEVLELAKSCGFEQDSDFAFGTFSNEQLIAYTAAATTEVAANEQRLDYVLEHGAFIVTTKTDAGGKAYQLWIQDEDEVFWIVSGPGFHSSERKAIDAAVNADVSDRIKVD